MEIVKVGWLQCRTKILKNWKREWFVLTDEARVLFVWYLRKSG